MILVVGLSPAWQRTLVFERVVAGKVNRAKRVSETASGKGVNVARVIQQLGGDARLLTVAGGERGKLLVESLHAKQIPATVVRVAAETRICQTLLSDGPTTELVEEAGQLTRSEVARVVVEYERAVRRAQLVALSGTVPAGCGEDFYARLTRSAGKRGLRVVVDAQRTQLLNAVAAKPFAVKINRDELRACGASVRDLHRQGVTWVVITNGPAAIEFSGPYGVFRLVPPKMAVVNPIGSGDAMLAGLAMGLGHGWSMTESVWMGMACGTANAQSALPGELTAAWVRRLRKFLWTTRRR